MINFEFDYKIVLSAINNEKHVVHDGMDIDIDTKGDNISLTITRYRQGIPFFSSLIFTNNDFFNKKLSEKFVGFSDKEMIMNNKTYKKLSGISYPFFYKLLYYILNRSLKYTDLIKKLKVDDKVSYEHMKYIAKLINKNC